VWYAGNVSRKITAVILSVVLICAVVFGGFAYYLNKPEMVVARAFSSKGRTEAISGNMDFKISFDTSKLMSLPEFAGNPFAAAQVAVIRSALESAAVKLSFNGMSDGSSRLLMNGNVTLPDMLGKSTDFNLYVEGSDVWSKSGTGEWSKAQNNNTAKEEQKLNAKALLDLVKSSPITVNGDTISIVINPTVDDFKKILPKETIDEINKNSKDGITFEQVMGAVKLQVGLTIKKNSKLFIPQPYITKSDINVQGDLSKLVPASAGLQPGEKEMLEGISFSARGTADIQAKTGAVIQKPAGIK
jgi:hypothetical protein